jgi:hypothetical protein
LNDPELGGRMLNRALSGATRRSAMVAIVTPLMHEPLIIAISGFCTLPIPALPAPDSCA